MDVHSPERRSYNMSRIRGKDTEPELLVRKLLWANGYRYRLHKKTMSGKPDIVFSGQKKVIFIHGCFWHKHDCKYFKWPGTNKEFWENKIYKNVSRDAKNYEKLVAEGWEVLVLWECELRKNNIDSIKAKIKGFLGGPKSTKGG